MADFKQPISCPPDYNKKYKYFIITEDQVKGTKEGVNVPW